MKRLICVTPLFLLAQCTTLERQDEQATSWVGEYHTGGLGYGASLDLFENGTYEGSWGDCIGLGGESRGVWTENDGIVVFSPKAGAAWFPHTIKEMHAIVIEGDQVLWPERNLRKRWEYGAIEPGGFLRGGLARRIELERDLFAESYRGLLEEE